MSTTVQNGPTAPATDPTATKKIVNDKKEPRVLTRDVLFRRSFIVILLFLVLACTFAFSFGVTSSTAREYTFSFDDFKTVLVVLCKENWGLLVMAAAAFALYQGIKLLGKKMNDGVNVNMPVMLLSIAVIVLATLLLREYLPPIPDDWFTSLGFGVAVLVTAAIPAKLISLLAPSAPKGNTNP